MATVIRNPVVLNLLMEFGLTPQEVRTLEAEKDTSGAVATEVSLLQTLDNLRAAKAADAPKP